MGQGAVLWFGGWLILLTVDVLGSQLEFDFQGLGLMTCVWIWNKDSGFLNRFSRRKQSLQANCIAELQINKWALQLIIARYQS